MKIAVRLDDITPDMDWERFLCFKALLDRYQVKPLIGVVPDNRDPNLATEEKNREFAKENSLVASILEDDGDKAFFSYIRQLQDEGWCVAMHGFKHIYATQKGGLFPLNNFSEFAGLSFEKQKEMLAEGKKMLQEKGIETDIFMAPAHSYDDNTLKALKETGFRAVTDGFGSAPYLWKEIVFYPISFKLSGTLKKSSGYSTMVVHTGTVKDEGLAGYTQYFENPKAEWISYKEYMEQLPVRRSLFGRIKEFMMAKGKFLLMSIKAKI